MRGSCCVLGSPARCCMMMTVHAEVRWDAAPSFMLCSCWGSWCVLESPAHCCMVMTS